MDDKARGNRTNQCNPKDKPTGPGKGAPTMDDHDRLPQVDLSYSNITDWVIPSKCANSEPGYFFLMF